MFFRLLAPLLGAFYLFGCTQASFSPLENTSSLPSKSFQTKQPNWIYEPSQNGKIGGVGSSKTHIEGKTAQRSLAISRALDEIARQMGVSVNSVQKIATQGSSSGISTHIESYSVQTTSGKIVNASIKEVWYNEHDDELFVWMVCE